MHRPPTKSIETIKYWYWLWRTKKHPWFLSYWQPRAIASAVQHAATHSPLYQKLYRDHLEAIQSNWSMDVFHQLPVLTRSDLQTHDPTIRDLPEWMYKNTGSTGGSTGEPISFFCTPFGGPYTDLEQKYIYTKLWRPLYWNGVSYNDIASKIKMMQLSHHRNIPNDTQLFINPHDLQNNPTAVLDRIANFKPQVISCYSTFIASLSKAIVEQNREAEFSIPYIILNGEVAADDQRRWIERVLGGVTYSRYGLEETYWSIASEDGQGDGLIPYYENVYIEVVRPDGSQCAVGEAGSILVTDLANYVHPFIRYDTGDRGVLTERNGMEIRFKILGRTNMLVFNKAELTHHKVNEIMSPLSAHVAQYQFCKKSEHTLEVKIVQLPEYSNSTEAMIKEQLEKIIDSETLITFTYPTYIERSKIGKTRPFVDRTKMVDK